jgi:hypothetical protein
MTVFSGLNDEMKKNIVYWISLNIGCFIVRGALFTAHDLLVILFEGT